MPLNNVMSVIRELTTFTPLVKPVLTLDQSYTTAHVATLLGVTRKDVVAKILSGELNAVLEGENYVISGRDIARFEGSASGLDSLSAKPKGCSSRRCEFVAETYLDWFVEYIAKETIKRGKPPTVEQLRKHTKWFRKNEVAVGVLFNDSFVACSQARLNASWEGKHHDTLVRLLIHTIYPLFIEDGGVATESGGLSRLILPGLFLAIKQVVGTGQLASRERKCAAIVAGLQGEQGENFAWDDFFDNAEAKVILLKTLAELIHVFDDFEAGREWFIDLVNNAQNYLPDEYQSGASNWKLNEGNFKTFAIEFFKPLRQGLDGGNHKHLENLLDVTEMDTILKFIDNVYRN